MSNIGGWKYINIRQAFKHEAHDFTVWLAQNLDVLTKQIGLGDLILEGREVKAKDIRADIVCRDGSGNFIVIENQLESSDDDHFIRLVQYMSRFKANTAIWITPEPSLKHQEVIQHLVTLSKPEYAFFLVKVEAVSIDNSRPAPLFTVIVRPSEQPEPVTETEVAQYVSVDDPAETAVKSLPTTWCIYPRRDKETYDLFLNESIIGLGFGNLGNLKKIPATPEAFKDAWAKKNPFTSNAQNRTFYPMFYSLAHRVKIGDLVVYPSTWLDRKIHVGKITGDYEYRGGNFIRSLFVDYADIRPVEWIEHLPREIFSPTALKGIGVTLAIFQVRNEDFLQELATKLR